MLRWNRFFSNIQQDAKLFLFFVGVFCLFRLGFVLILRNHLSADTSSADILFSLYYGLKLSLKSAGLITALTFVCCTFPDTIFPYRQKNKVRLTAGYFYIGLLSLLFQIRIPYYEQFHMVFSPLIFNTMNDDVTALFYTMVRQYHLPARLLAGLVIALVLCRLLKYILKTKTYPLPSLSNKYSNLALKAAVIAVICILSVFIRWGGTLSSAHSVEWRTCSISRDDFLNEAILDDIQALNRAKAQYELLKKASGLDIRTDKMMEYGKRLHGTNEEFNHIEQYFKRSAHGAIVDKPKHIFLIIGESYANWPLMEKYQNLNMANGMRNIIARPNAVYVPSFLPNGSATAMCVTGIVAGLADVNLSPNYQAESYKAPYATAIAPQMKRLGYTAKFWYGGFNTWERIRDFTLAQGFDEFHGFGDFDHDPSNIWGTEDRKFLSAIDTSFDDNNPSFNVILTVSNHGPYTVDLSAEGFEAGIINAGLPDNLKNNQAMIKELGHFWYSDKCISEFIQNMHQKHPDSLFIFIGDHADRTNIEANPSLFERYAIPFVMYGKGIRKDMLPPDTAGCQLNIMPTLLEMIAPRGFEYYSICQSMTNGNRLGLNHSFWITSQYIGKINSDNYSPLPGTSDLSTQPDIKQIQDAADAVLAVSWWRVKNGQLLE